MLPIDLYGNDGVSLFVVNKTSLSGLLSANNTRLRVDSACSIAVRRIHRDEKSYYEALLDYSRKHLMLYPYHLSDFIVTQMRVTPFQYYTSIMQVCASNTWNFYSPTSSYIVTQQKIVPRSRSA